MGAGAALPQVRDEHHTYAKAVAGAERVLAILPRFMEENAEMKTWLPLEFPAEPDRAFAYSDRLDLVRCHYDTPKHSTVEIIDGLESSR